MFSDEDVRVVLAEQFPHNGYVCDTCGKTCGHHLQYCWSCPGRLHKIRRTYLETIKHYKSLNHNYYNTVLSYVVDRIKYNRIPKKNYKEFDATPRSKFNEVVERIMKELT